MKNKKLLLIILVMTLIFSSSISIEASSLSREEQLIVGWQQDTSTLDPGRSYEMYTSMVMAALYDNLVKFEGGLKEVQPHLAKSWEIKEDRIYTFKLREGVKFTSGNQLTAEDIKWSYERVKNLNSNASFQAENIENIKVIDDYTVEITLKEPEAAFLSKLATSAFGVLDSEVVKSHGGTSDQKAYETDNAQNWLDSNSAGTGPFILEDFEKDNHVILSGNMNYWKSTPDIKRIILQHIPDLNTQMLMIRKGDIDVALNLSAEQVKQLKDNEDINIVNNQTLTWSYLLLNQDPEIGGPVSNNLVGQAIKYAIDYKGIHQLAGPGSVTPKSIIQVGFMGALPARDPEFQDLEKAKDLLKEAGYPNGFETTLDAINMNFGGVNWVTLATKIKSDLEKIGIEATIRPKELSVGLPEYRDGEWPFAITGWGPDYADPNNQLAFLPGNKVGLRANWEAEDNPELVELGKLAMVETDLTKRLEILKEIQKIMDKEGPFISLLQHPRQLAVKSNITGAQWHEVYKLDLIKITKE